MTHSRTLTVPTPKTPAGTRWEAATKRARKKGIRVQKMGDELWLVESTSTPGRWYQVVVRDDTPVSCDCVGSYGDNVCQHRAAVGMQLVPKGQAELFGDAEASS